MTFSTFSPLAVVAGIAGLAAVLFVLQQLRTRRRDVTVVTTLFWRQLVDEAPVRTLRERFRYPWAYALILLIASILWLAAANPRIAGADDGVFHVLVLDGSAGMAAGDRFAEAVGAIKRLAARLPRARRQVVWAGADIRPLLNPGEHEVLLAQRLAQQRPEPAPASVERLLRQLSNTRRDDQALSVVVFGDAPIRADVVGLVPASMQVTRVAAAPRLEGNTGIVSLGVSDAASGAWDKVDVFVGLQATPDRHDQVGAAVRALRIDLDGRTLPEESFDRTTETDAVVVRDLPAAGGLLSARLDARDALPLDDAASIRLPERPIVHVLLSRSLESVIGPVLDADPGIETVGDGGDVVIRHAGEAIGGQTPALEFVRAADQPQAFLITHPASLDSGPIFTDAVADIGLTQIDAMSLAQSTGRAIEVSIAAGAAWRFSVWDDLISQDYDFTRSRAFPLFVANAVRWLAGTKAWYPVAAAGRPLVTDVPGTRPQLLAAGGRALDPVDVDVVPAAAGPVAVAGGVKPLAVSLLDADVTQGVEDSAVSETSAGLAGFSPDVSLSTWLLLAALGLLVLEWRLGQRGRVP